MLIGYIENICSDLEEQERQEELEKQKEQEEISFSDLDEFEEI